MKIEEYNQSKKIKIASYVCVALILLFVVASFAQCYSIKLNLTNPLIPEQLVEMTMRPYLIKGILLSAGITAILILNFFKKNAYALTLAILLIAYYIFSDHYVGSWNTQIN